MREFDTSTILQIHHHEGDFTHHVDPAHLLAELDAIENDQLAVDACDVAQMEVTVALADEAPSRRRRKVPRREACSRSAQRAEALYLTALRFRRQQPADLGKVPLRNTQNSIRRAKRAGSGGDADRSVKGRHLGRERVDIDGP